MKEKEKILHSDGFFFFKKKKKTSIDWALRADLTFQPASRTGDQKAVEMCESDKYLVLSPVGSYR